LQQTQGASFTADGWPAGFGDPATALAAVDTAAVLIDRSSWGLLEMTGGDRLRFLHNQTTNSFTQRQPGDGCDTVFVTATARTLDLATVYATDEALHILTSPGYDQRLFDWMDRYIFPADQVALKNLSGSMAIFSLVGPQSAALLTQAGVALPPDLPTLKDGQHREAAIADIPLRVAQGSGLGLPGFTLVVPSAGAAALWQALTSAGAIPAGEALWQQLRVRQGRPAAGAELTDDYNPLEAGLWHTISFDKGCYIGQETIARLNTYQGVKQQLWGLRLSQPAAPGTPIVAEGEKVGLLTSAATVAGEHLGLGYLRTRAGGAGLTVAVGEAEATVVEVPFLSRGYLSPGS
jgi:folate-binding protein YgfZ